MRCCTGRGRRCTGRRNLTGGSLVSGFVDTPGSRDDIVAYADKLIIVLSLRLSKDPEIEPYLYYCE